MKRTSSAVSIALLALGLCLGITIGCGDPVDSTGNSTNPDASNGGGDNCVDNDGDGFDAVDSCDSGTDCDDNDDSIHPSADDICGNGVDEDCSMGDKTCEDLCVDEDKDGYGEGEGCRDTDCDDSNADRHPGAKEICDNGVDENCDMEDKPCAAKCTDMDGDGFGKMGENGDCRKSEPDCNDGDADVNPEADEVCNDIDDNCNGKTDECENENATCTRTDDGETCLLSIGDACEDGSLCPRNSRCDPESGECRRSQGAMCSMGECLDALACDGGTCQGTFCKDTTCPQSKPRCDNNESRCVECRYWGSGDPTNCESGEECVAKGWCGKRVSVTSTKDVPAYSGVDEGILKLTLTLADCWKEKYDGPSPDMCAGIETNAMINNIQESDVRDAFAEYKKAYENGNLKHMSDEQYNQLGKLLGDGWTDLNNLTWKKDIAPSSKKTCVWYDNHGTFGRAKLHVQACSDFDLPN